jgi:hypothetical protein
VRNASLGGCNAGNISTGMIHLDTTWQVWWTNLKKTNTSAQPCKVTIWLMRHGCHSFLMRQLRNSTYNWIRVCVKLTRSLSTLWTPWLTILKAPFWSCQSSLLASIVWFRQISELTGHSCPPQFVLLSFYAPIIQVELFL